ncbi:MAG: alpha-galactosidase [Anaerolineae bacterium]
MDIQISTNAPQATALQVEEFPMIRFDCGLVTYQEALIDGQYLVVNASATGRPRSRDGIWLGYHHGAWGSRPQRLRQAAFQLEVDGQLLHDHWEWREAGEVPAARAGCRQAVVTLRHTLRPVEVRVHTMLDDTSFLTRWLEITNLGSSPCALAQVFPWSGQAWEPVGHNWTTAAVEAFGRSPFSLGHFSDHEAGNEGNFVWQELKPGLTGFESMHGRSGWGLPHAVLRNEISGEMLTIDMGWSGNWLYEFYSDQETFRSQSHDQNREVRLYARIGMAGPAPLRVLAPGETASTPEVHLGFQYGDLDACVQALHEHERRSVILPQPAGREHRVELNHTGYTRNEQVTEWQLYEEIDMAADIGVELFMLDAGWFGSDDAKWWQAVGDWDRESPLLPHGVRAAFDRMHAKGLLGGLWVEAERMGPASHLLRDHPDWQMSLRGEKIPNLDLSRKDIADHLEQTIVDIIERYGLDCYRLDYNISTGPGGERALDGYSENVLWRYYDNLYALFDHIHARFPNLLLENCSSGGGRNDLGIMKRFHWTQTTDKWSPMPTLKVSNGVTLALAPELCETFPGAISDGQADLDFLLRTGFWGHLAVSGIFPNTQETQAVAREHWRRQITLYKEFIRPMLSTSKLYHHTPVQNQRDAGDWVVLECVSADKTSAYAGVFRYPNAQGQTYHLTPRGLDLAMRYRVTFDSAGWERVSEGSDLLEHGLHVPVPSTGMSELVLFVAI